MISFGNFQIDPVTHRLFEDGRPVKIERIPLDMLLLLIRRRESVVSRQEIADAVWGPGKFMEVDEGINTAIRKIRRALNENTDEPRFIATVVGRGYRFIAPVEGLAEPEPDPEPQPAQEPAPQTTTPFRRRWLVAAVAAVAALFAAGSFVARRNPAPSPLVSLTRLTDDTGSTGWPDISADGKMLAYASNRADADNLDIYFQPIAGRNAIRLTDHPARDVYPVLSPKGDQIAFESYRDPPGVYLVPVLGGEARLLAKGGARPRFSPDGESVAYLKVEKSGAGSLRSDNIGSGGWSTWLIPAAGGEPRQLRPELKAGNPVWASNDLLILTGRDAKGNPDWWLTPKDGSWTRPLGVFNMLRQRPNDFSPVWAQWTPAYVEDHAVVFTVRSRDSANLWRLRFTPDWKLMQQPERLTMMSDHVRDPSASSSGRIATAVRTRLISVYELPIDPNSGAITAEPRRLTKSKFSTQFVSVSADGAQVAYTSWRDSERPDIYLFNRATGQERQITATPQDGETFPRFSHDAKSIIYVHHPPGPKHSVRRMDLASRAETTICDGCEFMDETADGRSFLYATSPDHIQYRSVTGGPATEPVYDPAFSHIAQASLHPSNRWLAFMGAKKGDPEHRLYIAPFQPAGRLPKARWIDLGTGLTPLWSPNGEWIYFDAQHGPFRCIWRQRFDPVSGKLIGERAVVAHVHGDGKLITTDSMPDRGVARDRIVYSVLEETSNIWLMK
jgi:Tol biopolymer transport system component/DNA-binding winged helix-turn-helix (wHTH) protein